MLTPIVVLLLFAIGLLMANALGKLPAWPWGLCLILSHLLAFAR